MNFVGKEEGTDFVDRIPMPAFDDFTELSREEVTELDRISRVKGGEGCTWLQIDIPETKSRTSE